MRTIGILAITSLLSISGVSSDATPRPRLTVEPADAAHAAALDAAAQRFADAHLTLPDLNVRFSDDPTDCYGYFGTFDTATTPWTITICSELAFVPTHELAHAWIEANVDAETRVRYLESRHKERWDDKHDHWSDRGVEDAAFVIQQNLMIRPPTPLTPEWRSRADAYELLTGHTAPLRTGRDVIENNTSNARGGPPDSGRSCPTVVEDLATARRPDCTKSVVTGPAIKALTITPPPDASVDRFDFAR